MISNVLKFFFEVGLTVILLSPIISIAKDVSLEDSLEVNIPTADKNFISGILKFGRGNTKSHLIILVSSQKRPSRIARPKVRHMNFNYVADQLNLSGYSVFRFDSRGVGKSTGTNDGLTLYQHADDVESICRYFRLHFFKSNLQISLIGHSQGGAAATVVASRVPYITSLILLSAQGYTGWNFFNFQLKNYYLRFSNIPELASKADSLYKENEKIQRELMDTVNKYNTNDSIEMAIRSYFSTKDNNKIKLDEQQKIIDVWTDPEQLHCVSITQHYTFQR